MELEDHNCWTLGEALGHPGPHRLQHLLSRAKWDERQVLDETAAWAAEHLTGPDACPDGDQAPVFIVDETGDAKSSTDCVGAARQYSGSLGGVALCQVSVNLTPATTRGHTIIDRRLYLPKDWAADEERRELAGVPEQVEFTTKPQLAAPPAHPHPHPRFGAGFVAGDEVYGARDLRHTVRCLGMGYVMAVKHDHAVALGPHTTTARKAVRLIGDGGWHACAPAPGPRASAPTTGPCSPSPPTTPLMTTRPAPVRRRPRLPSRRHPQAARRPDGEAPRARRRGVRRDARLAGRARLDVRGHRRPPRPPPHALTLPDLRDQAGCAVLLVRRHRYTRKLSYYRCFSPHPVPLPLARLVAVATLRWKIEEDHQLAKQACGLDKGQTTRWKSRHRWTCPALLAYTYLAITTATEHHPDDPDDPELIPITVPDLLRLIRGTVVPPPVREPGHRLAWSLWRRRHQQRARECHHTRHNYAETNP